MNPPQACWTLYLPATHDTHTPNTAEQKPPLPHNRPQGQPSHAKPFSTHLTERLILETLLILEALLMPRLTLAPPCGCCASGLPPPWLTPSPDAMEARSSAAAAAAAARVSCWVLMGATAPTAARDGGAAPAAAAASTSRAAWPSAASSASLFVFCSLVGGTVIRYKKGGKGSKREKYCW